MAHRFFDTLSGPDIYKLAVSLESHRRVVFKGFLYLTISERFHF